VENGDGEIIWACGSPIAASFAVDDRNDGPFVRITLSP
jgi:hypothetical protein